MGIVCRMVPGEGIEPTWCCHRRILSPLRLPVPPSRLVAARLRVHYNGAAMNLSIDDFEYDLPNGLIAQHPSKARSASRLLRVCVNAISDHHFSELPDLLAPGDLLVFNDTKVIKARLFGKKETGGRIEVLIERLLSEREALAQIHAGRPAKPGSTLHLEGGSPAFSGWRHGPRAARAPRQRTAHPLYHARARRGR